MSTYVDMYVDRRFVFSLRNPRDLSFLRVFTVEEFQVVDRTEAERNHLHLSDPEESTPAPELAANVSTLRDRLSVLGVGREATAAEYTRQLVEMSSTDSSVFENLGKDDPWMLELQALRDMTFDGWIEQARGSLAVRSNATRTSVDFNIDPHGIWQFANTMNALRALVEVIGDGHLVVDLSELFPDWVMETADEDADEWISQELLGPIGGPVVLTEGSTDVAALRAALDVVAPHLQRFIRFFDFEYRPPGGAPALSALVRSFAAAGISNRVIAVFDNDTAGIEQMNALSSIDLPAHIRVVRLPDLPLANFYPTIGPSGKQVMDVNGKACSIELYFGRDVLVGRDGELTPIQWTGFNNKLRQFQGEVVNKKDLIRRFRQKALMAKQNEPMPDDQDWSGMELVFSAIISELGRTPEV